MNGRNELKRAMFYSSSKDGTVTCKLCPRNCTIPLGSRGACRVRENRGGELYSLVYGKPVSMSPDPIEKKPLFHFHPGSCAFSIATVGCNLFCKHCQNWEISQASPEDFPVEDVPPEDVVRKALQLGCHGIAYTYTEPTVFYEYVYDVSAIAKKEGLYNVLVTNGYISEDALREISRFIDGLNIDVKSIESNFYSEICGAKSNDAVLNSVEVSFELGMHVEVTNLIIPGKNDSVSSIRRLCRWLLGISDEIPIHFTRFYPHYKLRDLDPTPVETLEKAREIALEEGMKFVYIGNVLGHEWENTFCPNCGRVVIKRFGFSVSEINLVDKKCKFCGERIPIRGEIHSPYKGPDIY